MQEKETRDTLPMETSEIMRILPHRYPILMVDRIVECDFKSHIVGIKNLAFNEPFFQGHFPGDPVMPGVLQLEAMAQVSGILFNRVFGREGRISYFVSIHQARFRRILRPGDQMRIEVVIDRIRLGTARVRGKICVDGEVASEAEMMFRSKDD